jgi:hypothetical protein
MTTARISGPSKRMVEPKSCLHQAAVARGIRPRREAARVRGAHRDPDLLERAPVIRRPSVTEEPAAVRLLEREIHLEPAPVRTSRVAPTSLVAVDAEPTPEIGRMRRTPPRLVGAMPPAPFELMEPREGASGQQARGVRRRVAIHHRQPVLRVQAEPSDVAPPEGCRPQLPARGRLPRFRHGDGRARAGGSGWSDFAGFRGRSRSGQACEREQEPAGQDGAPQWSYLPVDCKSEAERAGKRPGRAPLGAAYAIVVPRVATAGTLVRS